MTAPRISDEELDWLAFRYVVGELHGTELEMFEKLSSTDDRFCTAVVEAVLLVEGVVQVEQRQIEPCVPVSQHIAHRPGRRLAAVAACCVAGLAVAIGWLSFVEKPADKQAIETASSVAALWVQGADEETNESAVSVNPDVIDLEDEDAVPGWLLAAVTEQQQAADGEEVMQD